MKKVSLYIQAFDQTYLLHVRFLVHAIV